MAVGATIRSLAISPAAEAVAGRQPPHLAIIDGDPIDARADVPAILLAFEQGTSTNRDVFSVALDGSDLVNLSATNAAFDGAPRWVEASTPLTLVVKPHHTSRIRCRGLEAGLRRVLPGAPVPWKAFSRMADEDLRAMYRYLKTVPPARRDNGPAVVTVVVR